MKGRALALLAAALALTPTPTLTLTSPACGSGESRASGPGEGVPARPNQATNPNTNPEKTPSPARARARVASPAGGRGGLFTPWRANLTETEPPFEIQRLDPDTWVIRQSLATIEQCADTTEEPSPASNEINLPNIDAIAYSLANQYQRAEQYKRKPVA